MWGLSRTTGMRTAVIGGVAVVVIGGASAMASIPSGNGTIYGCYAKAGGATRIIDPGTQKCTASEQPISWSQRGPRGPIGKTGPRGYRGLAGADGADGVSGYEIVKKDEKFEAPGTGGVLKSYTDVIGCPSGKQVIGGGGWFDLSDGSSSLGPAALSTSHPQDDGSGWAIGVTKLDGSYYGADEFAQGAAYAICVTTTS